MSNCRAVHLPYERRLEVSIASLTQALTALTDKSPPPLQVGPDLLRNVSLNSAHHQPSTPTDIQLSTMSAPCPRLPNQPLIVPRRPFTIPPPPSYTPSAGQPGMSDFPAGVHGGTWVERTPSSRPVQARSYWMRMEMFIALSTLVLTLLGTIAAYLAIPSHPTSA
jgi:hypothetical protein